MDTRIPIVLSALRVILFMKVSMSGAPVGQPPLSRLSRLTPYVASLVRVGGKTGETYGFDFFNQVKAYTIKAVEAVKDEDCDVIHCHDWLTFPAGIEVKKEKHKPLVITMHSTEYDRSPLSPNEWIVETEWRGMYEADRIITVSEYMKSRIMEKYNVPGDKIDVVYNAVDSSSYGGNSISFGLGDRIVLFLGRLAIQKGPDYFLEAARKVLEVEKDVKFLVVGTGHMLPQLIKKSIDMGISNNVYFTGYVDSIREYYKMADVYVMPSVSEPFGITALEAMASGTPLILSKQSGVSEVVNHCMTVDFWDVNEMANKIIGILRYAPLKREMGVNGFREAQGFNWLNVADKTISLYSRVCR